MSTVTVFIIYLSLFVLKIRLQRSGRKGRANYRIVVAEHSSPIQGRSTALVGTYDPLIEKHGLKIDAEAVAAWISKGAKPTNTVARLLKGQGIAGMEAFIVEMRDKKVKNPKEKPEAAPAPAPVAEAAPTPAPEPAPVVEVAPEPTPAPEAPAPAEPPEASSVDEVAAPTAEEKTTETAGS